jgi:putative phosphoesterase
MLIAIVSDTHSREANIRRALALLEQRGAQVVLHCGDIEDAEVVPLFPAATHFVYGNCDTDRTGIARAIAQRGATLHESFGHFEAEGLNLGFVHGDDPALLRDLIQSDGFDFVFHGHTHQVRDDRIGKTRVINPGALYRARVKTFALLDTEKRAVEWIEVEGK